MLSAFTPRDVKLLQALSNYANHHERDPEKEGDRQAGPHASRRELLGVA